MPEIDERIDQLQSKLENLVKTQENFQREISQIRYEINVLRSAQQKQNVQAQPPRKPPVREYVPPPEVSPRETEKQIFQTNQPVAENQSNDYRQSPNYQKAADHQTGEPYTYRPSFTESAAKSNLEKFIGENLISKIGIVILVIGVAIGAKYAIDNNLISPLTRIIIGYAFGFALLALAVRLKSKYHNFSAVLLSGGMAIMYFITYAAFSYYDLISQPTAFVLMLIFTAFTVATAVIYDRVVIAHIGLVGAYTIPFLLSDNSGRVAFLFTYTAIINAGILAISVRKYWKSLFYSSFIITWLIFGGWYLARYNAAEHFNLAIAFSTVFFLIFYLTFLSYKTFFREEISPENIALALSNSFIYYGFGFAAIDSLAGGKEYLGLFTLANAGLHFVVAFLLSRLELVQRSVLYLPAAMVLVFITIAVPVEFEGNRITLLWTAEAAILFALARIRQIQLYEYFSYPLMALSWISLLNDWMENAQRYFYHDAAQYPVLNGDFLTTILFVAAFVFIYWLDGKEKYAPLISEDLRKITRFAVASVILIALYNAFRAEIGNYFHYQTVHTTLRNAAQNSIIVNTDLESFNVIWQTNYTMVFLSLLALVNIKKFRSAVLGFINLGLTAPVLLFFLTVILYLLGDLRESYLLQTGDDNFSRGIFHILIRYISLAFVGVLIYSIYKYFQQEFIQKYFAEEHLNYAFDFIFYFSLWIIVSAELINWMDIFGYQNSYKLGLSILWGVYSLCLIISGIAQNKKHLRVGAIVLFALTLVKLFFYDIADLDTISKTVIFISLGILLLIISFLYNKYKNLIFETDKV